MNIEVLKIVRDNIKMGSVLSFAEVMIIQQAIDAAMLQGGQPVSQTYELPEYELPELIEGMEVSVDVSTCDFDAGHRYFGTVTEVSELDTAKNGYILLVQDAEPNFDVNGNSPVIPDGWISVSERMPPNKPGSYEYIVFDSLNNKAHHDYWNVPDGSCDDFSPFWNHYGNYVTHWMPLPAAPQPQNAQQNIPENIPAGKSTATPDCWISCSERMPAQDDWVLIYSKYGEYLAGQVQGEYVELNDGTLSWLGAALHWMPLPEPPHQEVK